MGRDAASATPVTLEDKVAFLRLPSSYPHSPPTVTAVETHMSWVFLAGDLAFKLKKPVRYSYLDFTTLEARFFACREEVRLNSRLAPGVYLGVTPLGVTAAGRLNVEGQGPVADWLVKMRRLPAERMLDWLIENGAASPDAIDKAAARLVAFYRRAPPVSQSPDEVVQRFAREHALDAAVLGDPRFAVDHGLAAEVLDGMRRALGQVRPLISARVELGVYVEGHGDLRPEHVCLLPEPVIIDCLEFSRDLRLLDPFDEVAFLALECERLGAAWVGERFLAVCRRELAHPAPPPLLQFYRAARALLRARLALAHLLEPNPRTPHKWEPRARCYLELANDALGQFSRDMAQNGAGAALW
jgi:aminoglycoside phosphotransferase family enzyme